VAFNTAFMNIAKLFNGEPLHDGDQIKVIISSGLEVGGIE
jgi:hypothetical protein